MASLAWEHRKKEVMFFVVTDKESGNIVAREKVRARDYTRESSYERGAGRVIRRLRKKYPRDLFSIDLFLAMSEHPIAWWAS